MSVPGQPDTSKAVGEPVRRAAAGGGDTATSGAGRSGDGAPDPRDGDLSAVRPVVAAQLGRPPRAMRRVAHVCSCGLPDVVETSPRLADGTPFPTLYYLTCPRAASAVGRLEAAGLMRTMTDRLATEPDLAARYQAATLDYLARRNALGRLPGDPTAGGMPRRVKCLHVHVAHELAVPGANPFGREALDLLDDWGVGGPCVDPVRGGPPTTAGDGS